MVTAPMTVPPRNQIPREYTWNAESVYESRAAWAEALKDAAARIPQLERYRGRLGESAATILEFWDIFDAVNTRVDKIQFYANMSKEVDSGDQEAIAMIGQAAGLRAQFLATSAFVEPELLAIGLEKLRGWMEQEPRLAVFRHYLENLYRRQEHVRSVEVEEILGMVAEPFGMIDEVDSSLVNADIKFRPAKTSEGQDIQITQGTLPRLLNNGDRELRRTAWESFADGHLDFRNTLTNTYVLSVKRDVFFVRARRHKSSIEASLYDNHVPLAVYHNLIDTFRKNLPTWHRYWMVRRRALQVDTLHPYDIWAPLTRNNPEISYAQAVDMICAGMKPLGDDYIGVLRRGCLQERWVDVYPNQGKRQGAFSYGAWGTHPFIMTSYTNNFSSMSVLAHELGHSMHSYLSWQTQPYLYSNYSLFAAEVASNFNQALVRAHLLKQDLDRDFQIALLEEAMYNFHRYFFIMPTLARFELEVHERVERGEGITADTLIDLMADLFTEAYGGEMHVDRKRVGITWAQFGHLFSNFYVFQYATGISAAHALAEPIVTGDTEAAQRYIEFLKAGGSMFPIDALRRAGVDMATPQAVEKTFATMTTYVDRLERLVGVS